MNRVYGVLGQSGRATAMTCDDLGSVTVADCVAGAIAGSIPLVAILVTLDGRFYLCCHYLSSVVLAKVGRRPHAWARECRHLGSSRHTGSEVKGREEGLKTCVFCDVFTSFGTHVCCVEGHVLISC